MSTRKILALILIMAAAFSKPGFAHEHRKVAGQYEFVVGFLNEPAFSVEMNGLDLRVSSEGKPIEGLEKSLEATVLSADRKSSLPLKLRSRYKQPGSYAAYFFPTKPGKYIFQIEGRIEGIEINETFESGPQTFHDIEDALVLRFP